MIDFCKSNLNTIIMKTKLLLGLLLIGTLMTSCYVEPIIEDGYIHDSALNTDEVLQSYDLWYVDINATTGNGEVPFLQGAFTVSFVDGVVYANNNLVGIGSEGNGFGIDVGSYGTYSGTVEINHDVDGLWLLDIYAVNNNTIEVRDPSSGTSYFLNGYQTSTFDYDFVFYDNIDYFLQEYDAWEKTYTSEEGALNDFDNENFLQFNPSFFRSSIDPSGTRVTNLQWDFEGNYQVYNIENDETLKTITLAYDTMGNDYFELYVLNDRTIELYHPASETVYEFKGRAHQKYLKSGKNAKSKKRTKTTNPIMKVKRSRIK